MHSGVPERVTMRLPLPITGKASIVAYPDTVLANFGSVLVVTQRSRIIRTSS